MLYIHQNNLLNKISKNYNNKAQEIRAFYNDEYLPMRAYLLSIDFSSGNFSDFKKATDKINEYYSKLEAFSTLHRITSQSKFASTYLEEISCYLFKDIKEIVTGELGVFNKKIYAGLKINSNGKIEIIMKDVDFCIGKSVHISIDGDSELNLIIPVIAVEVKTYLDATMFGEIKSSSKSIRSATPNSKTYVLMGYKNIADEHIVAARQDSVLSEMFVLRKNKTSLIDANVIYDYWKEITNAIAEVYKDDIIETPGRLLRS